MLTNVIVHCAVFNFHLQVLQGPTKMHLFLDSYVSFPNKLPKTVIRRDTEPLQYGGLHTVKTLSQS